MSRPKAANGDSGRRWPRCSRCRAPQIKEQKDLEAYEHVFANVEYWKRIGEEYQQPLIVTGTVLFTPLQRNQIVQREQEVYDSFGRRRVVPVRTYQERKGSASTAGSSSSTAGAARRCTRRASTSRSSTTRTRRRRRCRRISS